MVYPEDLMSYFIPQNPNFALSIMQGLSAKLRNATSGLEVIQGLLTGARKGRKIGEYIERHTEYDADGTPHFVVRV